MISAEQLNRLAVSKLGFEPNEKQRIALSELARFVCNRQPGNAFILNGFAGTGKSSVIGALANALSQSGYKFALLAPTGRAAKVAGSLAGQPASTIHRRIFRSVTADNGDVSFEPAPNPSRDTIFFVDEASMITDGGDRSRSLLAALIRYVYSAPGCAIVFIGDVAQLPPIGETGAPAMSPQRIAQHGINAVRFTLDQPARQALDSGILHNATLVRKALVASARPNAELIIPKLEFDGFNDIRVLSSEDLSEELSASWRRTMDVGTLLITRSNFRANGYNQAVRREVMGAEEPLVRGERLVIAKNNYYWSRENKSKSFVANGETAVVEWVGKTEKKYGRWFVDAELRFPADGTLLAVKLMIRALACDTAAIPQQEMNRMVEYAYGDFEGTITERMSAIDNDPYINAIQAKYAYCVTCHKAQGGQWEDIFIDMTGIDMSALQESGGVEMLRWLYTAMTRATSRLYLINPPRAFLPKTD